MPGNRFRSGGLRRTSKGGLSKATGKGRGIKKRYDEGRRDRIEESIMSGRRWRKKNK